MKSACGSRRERRGRFLFRTGTETGNYRWRKATLYRKVVTVSGMQPSPTMGVLQPVILAAGKSSRFGGQEPKCLAKVAGKEILMSSLEAIREVGFDRVTIVVGHHGPIIESWANSKPLPIPITFVHNPDNDRPSIHSLHCAHEALKFGGIILESDIIYENSILKLLKDAPQANVICVTPPRNRRPFLVKMDQEGRVQEWGYDVSSKDELVGIYKLSERSIGRLMHLNDVEYWDPLLDLAEPLFCVESHARWAEVDDKEELMDAERSWSEII